MADTSHPPDPPRAPGAGAPPTTPGRTVADERRLLDFLAGRDVDCPVCGYNLRNLPRPECPECREPLFLTVGAQRPPIGWFVATLAPSIFSGIAAVLLAIPIIASPVLGGGSALPGIVLLDFVGWVSGVAGLSLFVGRTQFLRLRPMRQRLAALATWLVHIGMFVTFALLVT